MESSGFSGCGDFFWPKRIARRGSSIGIFPREKRLNYRALGAARSLRTPGLCRGRRWRRLHPAYVSSVALRRKDGPQASSVGAQDRPNGCSSITASLRLLIATLTEDIYRVSTSIEKERGQTASTHEKGRPRMSGLVKSIGELPG